MTAGPHPYRVAVTADAVQPDGSSIHGDLGLDRLTDAGISWQVLPGYHDPIPAGQLQGVQSVLSLGHITVGAETMANAPDLRHVARFGAGFDTVDLTACTGAGVVVTNTPTA